jgi:hypothetical protein
MRRSTAAAAFVTITGIDGAKRQAGQLFADDIAQLIGGLDAAIVRLALAARAAPDRFWAGR